MATAGIQIVAIVYPCVVVTAQRLNDRTATMIVGVHFDFIQTPSERGISRYVEKAPDVPPFDGRAFRDGTSCASPP
jgi:hypothetical protein